MSTSECDACGRQDRLTEVAMTDDDSEWLEWWCPGCMADYLTHELDVWESHDCGSDRG